MLLLSTGSLAAMRLFKDPSKTVLLIEAGGEETTAFYSLIPAAAPFLATSIYNWAFKSEPQKYGYNAMVNRLTYWPRGKG